MGMLINLLDGSKKVLQKVLAKFTRNRIQFDRDGP